jgi:two-component system cell cycle response regulator DivK
VGFEEAEDGGLHRRRPKPFPQVFGGEAGEGEEALGPLTVAEHPAEGGKGQSFRVGAVCAILEHLLQDGPVGQKILVVEDNELNLKLFCDLLRAHGYAAEPVRDGRDAVARARAFQPDLIVMDIQMPHISGLELIEQLKGDAELRPIPIMAVTAYAAKGDEERIREAGAEGYVSKPISVVRFVEAVRALLAAPRPAPEEPQDEEEQEETDHEQGQQEEVRVERAFAVPAARVFDAWLDPETTGEWLFRTPDGELLRCEIDPRVGGRYEIVERRGDDEVLHAGTYEAIERPARLAFTLAVPLYAEGEERVTIDVVGEGEGCRLTLMQGRAADAPASAEQIERGWTALLDALAGRLEQGEEP